MNMNISFISDDSSKAVGHDYDGKIVLQRNIQRTNRNKIKEGISRKEIKMYIGEKNLDIAKQIQ